MRRFVMTSGAWACLVFVGLVASSLLYGDIRPKELKDAGGGREGQDEKAKEKDLEPVLDKGDHEEYHQRLAKEAEENLKEINRLLEEIQKNLGDKQTGAATQDRQKRVVERLQELVRELEKHQKG
jgi:uncharacterized FlaG/YvyC family protein